MTTQSNKLDFTGQNIYVGFDVHLKSWRVTIMTDHLTHNTKLRSNIEYNIIFAKKNYEQSHKSKKTFKQYRT